MREEGKDVIHWITMDYTEQNGFFEFSINILFILLLETSIKYHQTGPSRLAGVE